MKIKVVLAALGSILISTLTASALISVIPATGGTNISADTAANSSTPAWTTLGQISIDEQNGSGRGDLPAGTNLTLVLKAPTGFEFDTGGVAPSITFGGSKDILSTSIAVTNSTTVVVTYTSDGVGHNDTITIGATSGLRVRPTLGSPATNGIIYRPTVGGGTAVITNGFTSSSSGNGAGGTSFGSLVEVGGTGKSLVFTRQPDLATNGQIFGIQPIIQARDQFGNNTTVSTGTLNVVTALTNGTGPLLGTLTNNIGTNGGNGTITHTNLRLDTAGNNRQLSVSAPGLTGAVSATFKVEKGIQTITFPAIADHTYGDPTFGISATASSGLAVTLTVTAGPATIAGTNVTITGSGLVTITASQGGNGQWNAATSVNQSFTVNKATPILTWATPASIVYNTPLTGSELNASASVGGSYVYTPALGAVLPAGTNTLSVTFSPSNTNYNNPTGSVSLLVLKATPSVTWATPADIFYGAPLSSNELNATASVAGSFSYTPDFGTVLPVGTNSLAATFTPTDSSNYNGASAGTSVNVLESTPTIAWPAPADIVYGAALSTNELNATASVAGAFVYTPDLGEILPSGTNTLSVVFAPSNTNYHTVTNTATLVVSKADTTITWGAPADIIYGTALSGAQLNATGSVSGTLDYTPAAGTVLDSGANQTLSVSFTPDNTNYNGSSTTVSINVLKADTSITWGTPADVTYGTALSGVQLNATGSISGTLVYTPAAGTVLDSGANQTLAVSFTPDNTNYNGSSTTVSINVLKADTSITWGTPADITYGTALSGAQLNATGSISGTLVYTPAAGTVLDSGANQTLSVTFTPDNTNYSGSSTSVSINVLKADTSITWSTPADITYGTVLSGAQLNATGSISGTLNYTPAAGTVLDSGANQTLSVSFTPDNTNYNGSSTTVSINVLKADTSITWGTPADITYGTALSGAQLNATGSISGTLVYSPTNGTFLDSGANQTLAVSFTPDNTNYNGSSTTVSINVLKADTSITWSTPAAITYGSALSGAQLNATGSISGTLVYSPTNGTFLDSGANQTLAVSFTPDNTNYNGSSTTVSINVLKADTSITWGTPADITYGTALSGAQLNAAGSISGTLVYSPTNGTFLDSGANQTLSVSFTPDNTNYNGSSTSVSINVLKADTSITWSTPADITYGTALSGAQLNATGSISGTLVYSPTNGTFLDSGANQTLAVSFTPDNTNYNGSSTSVSINVLKADTSITWSTPAAITYGTALSGAQLNATGSISGTLVYTPAAGTVLDSGANQTLSVNFTPDNTNYNGSSTSVSINVLKADTSITWSTPTAITYGTALSGAQLNATGSISGTLVYTPAAGTVLDSGANQTLSVNFTPDNTNYNGSSTSVSINVLKADTSITWSAPAAITYGTALSGAQLNATGSISGTLVYTPAAGTVLNSGANQTLSVSFTPDNTNYNGSSTSVSINVLKADTSITWGTPADITYGTALSSAQLNATGSVSGTLVYTPASGTVLNAGANQALAVVFTPANTNYNGTNAGVSINVLRATSAISWATPADILYGTALRTNELNAVPSTLGTLTYTPSLGTVLSAGTNQTLSVSFVPANTNNYAGSSASVLINVQKAALTVKANDATLPTGFSSASFTASYTGFVNGDTAASLTTPVTFSTDADTFSGPGFYDIVPSGATSGNYNISFVNGTLTLVPSSTIVSTGAGGLWSSTSTWLGGVVPGVGDSVVIQTNATVTVDVAASCFSILLRNSPTTASTVNVQAGKSLSVGAGQGTITVGQDLLTGTAVTTVLLNVAGQVDCGNITLVARRPGVRNANSVLRLSNAAAVVMVHNNLTFDRAVVQGSLDSVVDFTAAGTLRIGGAFVSVGNGGALSSFTGCTVEYSGSSQTISNFTYSNLILSGSGVKTNPGALSIGNGGKLVMKDAATYAGATPTYPGNSTLVYASTNAQVSGAELPAVGPAGWNLTVSNAAGLTLSQSVSVAGALNLPVGAVTTGPNVLTVDGTVTRGTGYVIGNLSKNFTVGANVARAFEVGVSAGYAPVSITAPSVTVAGHLVAAVKAGDHSNIGSSILNAAKSVNLNWTVTKEAALALTTYNVTFNYSPSDIDAGVSTNLLIVGTYASGTWSYPIVASRTATNFQVNGLTTFGDFQIAESGNKTVPTLTWNTPSDIVYGTALSAAQLNASPSTLGTLTYSPAIGAVLDAGSSQTLTVTFVPADLANYTTATNTVSINVNKANLSVTADSFSRFVGEANPTFTGTLNGVVNNDNITASYSSVADLLSGAGIYPIIPALVDPSGRATNYTLSTTNGVLTVVAMVPATPALLSVQSLTNGHCLIQLQSAATNHIYSIEAVDTIGVGWQKIGEATNSNGTLLFEDANASSSMTRFYRAVAQ